MVYTETIIHEVKVNNGGYLSSLEKYQLKVDVRMSVNTTMKSYFSLDEKTDTNKNEGGNASVYFPQPKTIVLKCSFVVS